MEIAESGCAAAPSPLLIDLFSKPRGGSRRCPEPAPTSPPLFDWADSQSTPSKKAGGPAEVENVDQDANHAIAS
jgi:hypothetical protein